MGPLEILHDAITLARMIINQVEQVQTNKAQCKRLATIIRQLIPALQGLEELPRHQNFIDGLMALHKHLQQTSEFIRRLSQLSYARRLVLAGRHHQELKALHHAIFDQLPILQLGLSAELLVDGEQDRLAEQEDKAAVLNQEFALLKERQAAQSLQRRDIEAIVQKQMAAFTDQLDQHWNNTPPTASPVAVGATLPDALALPLYDITFTEKLQMRSTGDLYRGTWQDRPVLIKWIEGHLTSADRQQWVRESRLMSQLDHPHVVTFYGASIEPSRMCIVTSDIQYRLVDQLSVLSAEQRAHIALELLSGLEYLHSCDICHGHIHPSAIGITASGVSQWMDLSWIKTDLLSLASLGRSPTVTVWQAPEAHQQRGQISVASDVYSMGWLLWSLYTGRLPFSDRDPNTLPLLIQQQVKEDIPADCPYGELIHRCWSSNPSARPTLREIRQGLQPRPASPSGEAYYEQARAAEEAGDLATARPKYERSAEKGYMKSMTRLGVFALKAGQVDIAKKYLESASAQGHALADYNLGRLYEKGYTQNGQPDISTALFYYRQASARDPQTENYRQKVDKLTR